MYVKIKLLTILLYGAEYVKKKKLENKNEKRNKLKKVCLK